MRLLEFLGFNGGKAKSIEPRGMYIESQQNRLRRRLSQIMEKNLSDSEFRVGQLACEIGISRSQLYRKLLQLTGDDPTTFIRNYRLKKAAQLLLSDAGNVAEIAYEVGFSNLSYFSKSFKNLMGKLPSEYRKGKVAYSGKLSESGSLARQKFQSNQAPW